MILIIDNYDSFTYNIVQYVGELGFQTNVVRNDMITVDEVDKSISHIIISPGPCTPDKAGISIELIKKYYDKKPVKTHTLLTKLRSQICNLASRNPKN